MFFFMEENMRMACNHPEHSPFSITVESNKSDVRFYSRDVLVAKLGPAPSLLLRDRAYNLSGHSKMHILSYILSEKM